MKRNPDDREMCHDYFQYVFTRIANAFISCCIQCVAASIKFSACVSLLRKPKLCTNWSLKQELIVIAKRIG